jgi:hypothetical protein
MFSTSDETSMPNTSSASASSSTDAPTSDDNDEHNKSLAAEDTSINPATDKAPSSSQPDGDDVNGTDAGPHNDAQTPNVVSHNAIKASQTIVNMCLQHVCKYI